jgi:hypothetical protein
MPNGFITPTDWESKQHYKDRTPPWIKLHKNLLDNYEFFLLKTESKAFLAPLWLLASEYHDASIPLAVEMIAFRMRTDEKTITIVLNDLIERGFFVADGNASALLAACNHDARPEKRREETEIEERQRRDTSNSKKSEALPEQSPDETTQVFEFWKLKLNHPQAKLDQKRKLAIQKALKSHGIDTTMLAIDGCSKTPWNVGENPNGTIYDDLTLILRDAANIERFASHSKNPPAQKITAPQSPQSAKQQKRDNYAEQMENLRRKVTGHEPINYQRKQDDPRDITGECEVVAD